MESRTTQTSDAGAGATLVGRVALAAQVAVVLTVVYGVTLAASGVMIGVFPRFLDGLVTIFLLPAGLPIAAARLAQGGEEDEPGLLAMSLGLGAMTFWLPAVLYFAELQASVDLLWRPTWDGTGDPRAAGWIEATLPPDVAERAGVYQTRSSSTKSGAPRDSVVVAAPTARTGDVDVWVCDVAHAVRDAEAQVDSVRASLSAWTGGGPVVRDAASVGHCDAAAAAASDGDAGRPRVYVAPGVDPETVGGETRQILAVFLAIVWALWVGIPVGLALRGSR